MWNRQDQEDSESWRTTSNQDRERLQELDDSWTRIDSEACSQGGRQLDVLFRGETVTELKVCIRKRSERRTLETRETESDRENEMQKTNEVILETSRQEQDTVTCDAGFT